MDEASYKNDVLKATQLLSGVEVPVYKILESQMGDPILSHWMGADGVVVGTALGRVSAYLFECPTLTLGDSARPPIGISKDDLPLEPEPSSTSSRPLGSSSEERDTSKRSVTDDSNSGSDEVKENPSGEEDADKFQAVEALNESNVEDDAVYVDIDDTSQDKVDKDVTFCGQFLRMFNRNRRLNKFPQLQQVFPGRYTVFASFSDEPVYAVFVHNRLLYSMIGTSSFCIYNVDDYKIEEEYRLQISRSTEYKQVLFADYKILIESVRGSSIVDPVLNKQSVTFSRLYPSNLLDFNGSMMVCYHSNQKTYIVFIFLLDHKTLKNKIVFSVTMPNNIKLVTHGKFWGSDKLVIVTDLLNIFIYKYHEGNNPILKKKMNVDIVNLCCGYSDFLVILTKSSSVLLLHPHTLDVFYKFSLRPATFELGWPYSIINYENMLSVTSDEGVYCFRLPQEVMGIFN